MVSVNAYLAIEKSLSNRLVKSWRKLSKKYLAEAQKALDEGDTAKLAELITTIDLTPVFEENLPYIKMATKTAMLFGATRLTKAPSKTSVAKNYPVEAANASIEQLKALILGPCQGAVQQEIASLISRYEVVQKFNPHHEPAGSSKGGQFAKRPTFGQADKLPPEKSLGKVAEAYAREHGLTSRTIPDNLEFYHGTAETALKSIMERGIVADIGIRNWDTEDYFYDEERKTSVYLATEEDIAAGYAEAATVRKYGAKRLILRVEIPLSVVNESVTFDEEAELAVRVRKITIKPEWITGVKIVPRAASTAILIEDIGWRTPKEVLATKGGTKVVYLVYLCDEESKVQKFNPLHAPKGTPIGGQFIAKPVGAYLPPESQQLMSLLRMTDSMDAKDDLISSDYKANVCKELARRLNKNEDFLTYFYYWEAKTYRGAGSAFERKAFWEERLANAGKIGAEYREPEFVAAARAAVEKDRENTMAGAVSELIHTWCATASDSHVGSHAIQLAAQEEFGLADFTSQALRDQANSRDFILDLNDYLLKLKTPFDQSGHNPWDGIKAFLSAQYEWTQEVFKHQGIKELTLSRGMSVDDSEARHQLHKELGFKSYLMDRSPNISYSAPLADARVAHIAVGEADLESLPLSSWSLSDSTAAQFMGAHRGISLALTAKIPVRDIIAFPFTGFGCRKESEFVVLGRARKAKYMAIAARREDLPTFHNPNGYYPEGSLYAVANQVLSKSVSDHVLLRNLAQYVESGDLEAYSITVAKSIFDLHASPRVKEIALTTLRELGVKV